MRFRRGQNISINPRGLSEPAIGACYNQDGSILEDLRLDNGPKWRVWAAGHALAPNGPQLG